MISDTAPKVAVGVLNYVRWSDAVEKMCRVCSGLIVPVYKNILDHVDHTNRIIRGGFHPPFWWFADLAESWRFIDDLEPDLSRSNMGHNRRLSSAFFLISNLYFSLKNGFLVRNVPNLEEKEVDYVLTELKRKFARH